MSAQAQKFQMFQKKPSLGIRSPWLYQKITFFTLDGPLLANFWTSAAASLYSQADLL